MGRNQAAIPAHRSQPARTGMASGATVTALGRQMPWSRRVGYAEAFRAVRLTLPRGGLPLDSHGLAVAEPGVALPPPAELIPLLRSLDQPGVPSAMP